MKIWSDAIILAKEVYLITSNYPEDEKYGLVSQLNRCSVSVPSNIAEGSSRSSNKEFARFLKIALGSLFELETQIILSHELDIIKKDEIDNVSGKIAMLQKMIIGFLNSLK